MIRTMINPVILDLTPIYNRSLFPNKKSISLTGKVTPVLKYWELENSYELDNTTMAYLLVQSLYKNKLINEATYEKIMRKYKRRSVVYAKKRYDQSA